MSWFKNDELQVSVARGKDAFAIPFNENITFRSDEDIEKIREIVGQLPVTGAVFFMTNGAWSNIRLIEYLLDCSGPAELYFSTWSLSAEAVRKFVSWRDAGTIRRLVAVLDEGIRNRKPEIYQEAIAAFPELKFTKCHAKVAVIIGVQRSFCIMGSANFTRNPRREAGIIITDPIIVEANAAWIREEGSHVQ